MDPSGNRSEFVRQHLNRADFPLGCFASSHSQLHDTIRNFGFVSELSAPSDCWERSKMAADALAQQSLQAIATAASRRIGGAGDSVGGGATRRATLQRGKHATRYDVMHNVM